MPTTGFQNHVAALAAQGGYQGRAAAAPGLAPRVWQLPPASPTDGTDIQNPEFWITALDRADLNAAYVAAFAAANPVRGQAMACKSAADYMGAYERAVQARYASPARCRAWAGARRTGHSDTSYGVLAAVLRQLEVWGNTTPTETESSLTSTP